MRTRPNGHVPKRPPLKHVAAVKVPAPPEGSSPEFRAAWLELSEQVEHINAYAASDYSAFRLLVTIYTSVLEGPDVPRRPALLAAI